jgi:hypothetical protein
MWMLFELGLYVPGFVPKPDSDIKRLMLPK